MTSTFRQQLAEPRPFPGGGSAAAYVGDIALALVEKVVRLEMKRCEVDTKKAAIWNGRLSRIANLATQFQFLIREDGRAYDRMSSMRSRVTPVDIVVEVVREAAMVPLQIIRGAIQGLSLISEGARECKKYLVPDLQVSCELLWAVARGAEAIAEANIMLLESEENRTELQIILTEAVESARELYEQTRVVLQASATCRSSLGSVGDN
jgi:formiminotetrahydrofolate cyclodeaminase